MVNIRLGNVENLYVGFLYYVYDYTADNKPLYKISDNKYFFSKYQEDGEISYFEYFSGVKFSTMDDEKLANSLFDNLKPRVVNLLPFSAYYPDVVGIDDMTLLVILDEINSSRKIDNIINDKYVIKISDEYSKKMGKRYIKDGPCSGEDFRDNYLVNYLYKCKANNCKLLIDFDGVSDGYSYDFLEEAFGGLVRLGYSSQELFDSMVFISNEHPFLIEEIERCIKEASIVKSRTL